MTAATLRESLLVLYRGLGGDVVRGQLLASGVGLLLVEVAVERIFVPMHYHTSLEDNGGGVRRW